MEIIYKFIGLKMAKRIYSEEFRIDAVNQVIENGYSVPDTAQIGVHLSSLNSWIRHLKSPDFRFDKFNFSLSN